MGKNGKKNGKGFDPSIGKDPAYPYTDANNVNPLETDLNEFGVDFKWSVQYRFLRDDLVDANVQPEVGDFIMFQNGYWEIDNVNTSQFFVGKDPAYPYTDANNVNPLETDLNEFGYNVSVICSAHYVPADRVGIVNQRI